jgi:hypothetical protein
MKKRLITRRDFFRATAGMAIAAALGPESANLAEARAKESQARVVLIRDPQVFDRDGKIRGVVLQKMLDEGLKALTEEADSLRAWKKRFRKEDIVGIKSNAWGKMPTPEPLESAIRQRLLDVGIEEKNISIDDRGVLENPVFLRATALVNVRPLRTHFWSGIGGCLKNYIMFVPNPSAYHGEACADLGKIWTDPRVRGKTRLNLLSVLTPQFYGRGPHFFDRRYVWPYGGILLGIDPVALDAVGARLLQLKRIAHFGEDRALDVQPTHISVAEKKYQLGVSDLDRIQIVRLGSMEDALI